MASMYVVQEVRYPYYGPAFPLRPLRAISSLLAKVPHPAGSQSPSSVLPDLEVRSAASKPMPLIRQPRRNSRR